jgi:voltage-gated sodium channel
MTEPRDPKHPPSHRSTHDVVVEEGRRFEGARTVGVDGEGPAWRQAAARLTESPGFGSFVIGLILLNGIIIGLETYPAIRERIGGSLHAVDRALLAFFTLELLARLAAVGFNPLRFFSRGWNVFDFVAVSLSFVPGLGANSTALRLVRLLRVARLLSVVPDVRVLLDGIRRALRPAAGLVVLTLLLLYLYAIVGWSLFHEGDPERWGTAGESMLTLFTLLTLEGWNEIMLQGRAVSPLALPFILSFILVGTFVVLNLVIGVVITSLDEAHAQHRRDTAGEDDATATIQAIRDALEVLERRIEQPGGVPPLERAVVPDDR